MECVRASASLRLPRVWIPDEHGGLGDARYQLQVDVNSVNI